MKLRRTILFYYTIAAYSVESFPMAISQQERQYRKSGVCFLNRFLLSPEEVSQDEDSSLPYAVLGKDDYRTIHAAKILNLRNGDSVRAGLVSSEDHNGFLTDHATVQWLPEGKVKKAEVLNNGDPPGSLHITLQSLKSSTQRFSHSVSLILALPRPLQLGRMLPMISQMGVDHLVLTEARKVPKDYFGSHLFRKPELLTERLIEGLCQSGDTKLPQVTVVKNLSQFMDDTLDELFPLHSHARVIAHPQRVVEDRVIKSVRMRSVTFPTDSPRRMVIAVGPEGGWEEPNEIDRFVNQHGFQQITMGTRVLRSDCAVVSLLGLAHDICDDYSE
jgi:RsmE family RNA methyltransferase